MSPRSILKPSRVSTSSCKPRLVIQCPDITLIRAYRSLVGMEGLATQSPLLKAFSKSTDLEAFTVAEIGSPFSDEELADPKYAMFASRGHEVESLGLSSKFASLFSGDYADYAIGYG